MARPKSVASASPSHGRPSSKSPQEDPSPLDAAADADEDQPSSLEDQNGHVIGGASEFAFLHIARRRLSRLPSALVVFRDHPLARSGALPPVLPPLHTARRLMRRFFDFGLTTSRFVHEPTAAALLHRLYCQPPYPGHAGDDDQLQADQSALLLMIFALGSHYMDTDAMFCGYVESVRFYDMASSHLASVGYQATLASSQALLLVVHFLLNHSRFHEAWSRFGLLVRDVQALGMHLRRRRRPRPGPGPGRRGSESEEEDDGTWRARGGGGDTADDEFRKRLFWAVYTHDRILSSVFGRPCAINDADVDQQECTVADDASFATPTTTTTTTGHSACSAEPAESYEEGAIDGSQCCPAAAMVHYARLARVLGRILGAFYSPGGAGAGGDTQGTITAARMRALAAGFEEDLAQWRRGLPPWLDFVSLPPSAMSVMIQRQMCTLKLMYTHAQLLLYRPFMLQAIASRAGETVLGGGGGEVGDLGGWVRQCHDKSIEAANTIVLECQHLLQQGWFSRAFWLVNYAQFAAIGTLLIWSYISPKAAAGGARETAMQAMDSFPRGVEGDPAGQRYLEVLRELSKLSSADAGEAEPQPEALVAGLAGYADERLQLDLDNTFDTWSGLFFGNHGADEAFY